MKIVFYFYIIQNNKGLSYKFYFFSVKNLLRFFPPRRIKYVPIYIGIQISTEGCS